MENKIPKGTISLIIGVVLAFFGFAGIVSGDFIAGIALLIPGLLLIPKIGKLIEDKWKVKITKVPKIILVVVGLFIFGSSIDSQDSTQPEKQDTVQEAVSDTKPENEAETESVEIASQEVLGDTIDSEPQSEPQEQLYPVLSVVDGDTVAVEIDGKEEVLRLIGINTPETVDPRKPVECFGKEASSRAKEMLTDQKVKLEADPTQGELDKYDRLLRYVILEDGTNFNKKMIEDGYAYEYTYNVPYKYQSEFKEAEKKAREEKRGLWAEDTCNGELNKTETTSTTSTTQTTTPAPTTTSKSPGSSGGTCAGKRTCGEMANCSEAYFYLNNCGVSSLDRDKDGIPCETICN